MSSPINSGALLVAASFFVHMNNNVQCDTELENILDNRSILRCMRLPAIDRDTREYYLVAFIPSLLHFFKRSVRTLNSSTRIPFGDLTSL